MLLAGVVNSIVGGSHYSLSLEFDKRDICYCLVSVKLWRATYHLFVRRRFASVSGRSLSVIYEVYLSEALAAPSPSPELLERPRVPAARKVHALA